MLEIFYTGVGSKENGIHSVNEFLEIMNRLFVQQDTVSSLIENRQEYSYTFGDWCLPYDFRFFELNDWLEYSGAEIIKK